MFEANGASFYCIEHRCLAPVRSTLVVQRSVSTGRFGCGSISSGAAR